MSGHVYIAGGSSGIGAACRDLFLQQGWRVTSVARRPQEVRAYADRFFSTSGDLTDSAVAEQTIANSESVLGPITALVHTVGDIAPPAQLDQIDWSRWLDTLSLCLGSAVHVTRAALPSLRAAHGDGSVTFITSVGGVKPYPGIADYCAAKAALASFSRSVALELAVTRGRANCVSPAVVRTAIFEKAPFDETTAASWHKLGRIGEPQEIAELVYHLASPAGAWITGQDYEIDGGMTL